ncbi:MAG TPA: type II toxin-antitoxin system HicB family antitoxin [Gammaproteobacteria bacterium]
MNAMQYKGYTTRVDFHAQDKVFVGRVLGIADRITFHGSSVRELEKEFHAAINHYIADCEATGREPLKPASGKLMLRIPPETHAAAAIAAQAAGKSLNQWAAEAISRAADASDC